MSIFDYNNVEFLKSQIQQMDEFLATTPESNIIEKHQWESIKKNCQTRLEALLKGTPLPED